MAIKYNGSNALSYLLTLIKGQFVQKEAGKGLSTKDFTAELEAKLNGIEAEANKYVHPTHTAAASGFYKVTVDSQGHVTAVTAVEKSDVTALGIPAQDTTYDEATTSVAGLMSANDKTKLNGIEAEANKYIHPDSAAGAQSSGFYKITTDAQGHVTAVTAVAKSDITALGIPGELTPLSTNIETDGSSDAKAATPKAVKTYVDSKISSTYKPSGSVAYASLPATPAEALLGNVYNVTDAFTTDARFIEGAGKKYPAGTNVAVIVDGGNYYYDVLSGFIDLSPYALTADIQELTNPEIKAIWDDVFTA